ncbi:MAG: DUF1929 domain-containing protein [Solirubrobacteraceae bacterium]|nr:DUF1929 domain-containing protein [Solirubrobacteraceae bacterium]
MIARLCTATTAALLAALVLTTGAHAADPSETGRWSAVQNYPVVPISAAVTPDGKIVAWDQADPDTPHSISPNNGKAMILDPETGAIARSTNLAPASVFCPLITTLPDGKIAIAGGGNDSTNSDLVQLYDPDSKTFGTWSTMSTGRWYGGGNITKNGDIVAIGGRGGSGADVIDAATGRNRRLTVDFGADWYPLALRMPDGRFTIENVTDLRTSNTPTRQILDIAGTGKLTGADDLTLLQRRLRMTMTMVGPHTMLGITGGTSKEAYLLDVGTGNRPVPKITAPTKDPHITGTAVTLPDGSAVVIGGNSSGSETYGTAVYGTERWSPITGQWTSMENTPRQRQYHSVAALLPDGRVWSAGTSINGSKANEYNGAYFSPPYLFKKDGSGQLADRPQITDAPKSASWGERVTLRTPQAASIRKASLVRMSATTHQYDFSGAFTQLDVSASGDGVSMTIPANGNEVPAGSYMIFLVDSAGVPSKAATVRIDPAADSTPNATTMMSSQYASANPAWKGMDGDTTNLGPHTKSQAEPWWQVDFGRSRQVGSITIHNRNDSTTYRQRLRSAWVFSSDQPFTSTTVAGTRAQAGVTATQLSSTVGATVSVNVNRSARYIRVQLPRTDYLHFRELVPTFTAAPAASLALTKVSQTDQQVVVKVANTGNASGTIQSVALPGAGWAQAAGPGAPFSVAAGGTAQLTLTRGTVDGDLVLTPSAGSALRLALQKAPVTEPPPATSIVPSPAAGGWQLNGSATIVGTALQLTPPEGDKKGTAFYPTTLDTTVPMTIEFDAQIADGTGADGLAMILADPTKGATATSVGGGGGLLAFGGIPGTAVALATYPQSTVGISDGSKAGAWQTLNYLGTAPLPSPLQNTTRHVKVTLSNGTLTATIDGATVSQQVALPNRVLLGFSAATGGLTNRHTVRDLVVSGTVTTPQPPTTPEPPAPSTVPDPAAGGWKLNGTSSVTGGKLQLTPAESDQKGSAFYPTAITVGTGKTIEFDATIADGTGADGLAMILADPTKGATPSSLGGGGGSLGFGGIPGLAVGLSTYPSSAVGISDGALAGAWQTLNWVSTAQLLTPLQNATKHVKVTVTPTTVTAVIDGGVTVTKAMTVPSQVLLGFSAATGGLTNRHAVANVSVS